MDVYIRLFCVFVSVVTVNAFSSVNKTMMTSRGERS